MRAYPRETRERFVVLAQRLRRALRAALERAHRRPRHDQRAPVRSRPGGSGCAGGIANQLCTVSYE